MDDHLPIQVSPRHSVLLAKEYAPLLETPPQRDFVVRTLAKREAGTMQLMVAEMVIAGADTRAQHPLTNTFPLHFRKTYFPGRLHGDPQLEFKHHARASELIGLPPPIGYSERVFRACLIPGKPYNRISPFGADPEERNITTAQKLSLAAAAGLWRLAEEAYRGLVTLHEGGLSHGDAELHNFIVSPSPLELVLIDFEGAAKRASLSVEQWEKRMNDDLIPLLREAVFIQCALGKQVGPLAEASWERMDTLLKRGDRFRRAILHETTDSD